MSNTSDVSSNITTQTEYAKLIENGVAPYLHDKKNTNSYFATLKKHNGEMQTYWGVDIERSLDETKIKIGDMISLTRNGHRETEIDEKQLDGSLVKKQVKRVNWDAALQPRAIEAKSATPVDVVISQEIRQIDSVKTQQVGEKFKFGEPPSLLNGALVRDDAGAYRPQAGGLPVLQDNADSVTVKSKGADAYRGAMELVKAKGWTVIVLSGPAELLADAWLEAKSMNLEIAHYVPSDQDLKRYADRLAEQENQRLATEKAPAQNIETNHEFEPDCEMSDEEYLRQADAQLERQIAEFQARENEPDCEMSDEEYLRQADAQLERQIAEFKEVIPHRDIVTNGQHSGPIMAIEGTRFSQKIGRDPDKVVWHDLSNFSAGQPPAIGKMLDIQYSKNGQGAIKEKGQAISR